MEKKPDQTDSTPGLGGPQKAKDTKTVLVSPLNIQSRSLKLLSPSNPQVKTMEVSLINESSSFIHHQKIEADNQQTNAMPGFESNWK